MSGNITLSALGRWQSVFQPGSVGHAAPRSETCSLVRTRSGPGNLTAVAGPPHVREIAPACHSGPQLFDSRPDEKNIQAHPSVSQKSFRVPTNRSPHSLFGLLLSSGKASQSLALPSFYRLAPVNGLKTHTPAQYKTTHPPPGHSVKHVWRAQHAASGGWI